MKKIKILTPILASVATVAPLTTTLANCSCSNFDYTGVTKMLKEETFKYFTNVVCAKESYRETWHCQGIFDQIVKTMKEIGFNYVERDDWSTAAREDWQKKGGKPASFVEGDFGNVWYDIPATEGCEHWQKMILSANYDMTYDCTDEQLKHIKENGIEIVTDEENQTMYAKEKLNAAGFSDGLGIAFMFAFAKHAKEFPHGPVRLLFTADSIDSTPSYAGGAQYLAKAQDENPDVKKPFDTPYVLCTDGYKQSDINVSSAGIHQCQFDRTTKDGECGKVDFKEEGKSESEKIYKGNPHMFEVEVHGLTGAHSGTEMYTDPANAIKCLIQSITLANEGFRICDITTNETNSYRVPTQAKATIVTAPYFNEAGADITELRALQRANIIKEAFENAYPIEKGKIKIDVKSIKIPTEPVYALTHKFSNDVCIFVNLIKYGAFVWFDAEHKEPKTSANICPLNIKKVDDTKFRISGAYTCRSASNIQLQVFSSDTHNYLSSVLGMDISESTNEVTDVTTPVWENSEETHKVENKFAKMLADGYKRFRYTPKLINCHGCLEAVNHAYVIEKHYDKLSTTVPYIATIGPTISNFQTKNETLYMSTVNSCIRAFLYALQNINSIVRK